MDKLAGVLLGRLEDAPQSHPARDVALVAGVGLLDRKGDAYSGDRLAAAVGGRHGDAVGKRHRQHAGQATLVGQHVVLVALPQGGEQVSGRGGDGRPLLTVDGHFQPKVVVIQDLLGREQFPLLHDPCPVDVDQLLGPARLDGLRLALESRERIVLVEAAAFEPPQHRSGRREPAARKAGLRVGEALHREIPGELEVIEAVVGLGRLAQHDSQPPLVGETGQERIGVLPNRREQFLKLARRALDPRLLLAVEVEGQLALVGGARDADDGPGPGQVGQHMLGRLFAGNRLEGNAGGDTVGSGKPFRVDQAVEDRRGGQWRPRLVPGRHAQSPRRLQNPRVADPDPGAVVLEAEPAPQVSVFQLGVMVGVHLLDQLAVHPGGDHPAVGLYDHPVPTLGLVGPVERQDVPVDCHARLVLDFRVVGRIQELQLHAVGGGPAFFWGPDTQAGVPAALHLVFERPGEVGVELLGAEVVAGAGGAKDLAAGFHLPLGDIAVCPPPGEVLPVEHGLSAWLDEPEPAQAGPVAGDGQAQAEAAIGRDVDLVDPAAVDREGELAPFAPDGGGVHLVAPRFHFSARGQLRFPVDETTTMLAFRQGQLEALAGGDGREQDPQLTAVGDRPIEPQLTIAERPARQ